MVTEAVPASVAAAQPKGRGRGHIRCSFCSGGVDRRGSAGNRVHGKRPAAARIFQIIVVVSFPVFQVDTEPAARFVGEVCGSGGCNKDIRIICLQCQIGGRCRTPLHIGRGERICSVRIDGHLPLCRGQGVSRVGDRGGSGKGQIIPVAVADEIRLTGNQCAHIGGGGVNRRRSRHSVRKAGLLNLERAIRLCKRAVIAGQRSKVVSIAHIQGDVHHFPVPRRRWRPRKCLRRHRACPRPERNSRPSHCRWPPARAGWLRYRPT